jgi:diguanylate cyclase (GGDEF)-like protein
MRTPLTTLLKRLATGAAVIASGATLTGAPRPHESLRARLLPLLSTHFQPQLLVARRAATVASRVRLVAIVFAALTVLWIPVDLLVLDTATGRALASGRALAAVAFAMLALLAGRMRDARAARFCVLALIAIPSAFFLFAAVRWSAAAEIGVDFGLRGVYASAPFVIAAGLALFPLTALEALAAAAPIFLAEAAVIALGVRSLTPMEALGSLWLLLLVTGVAGFAGMAQVALMSQLLDQLSHDPLTGAYRRATGEELLALTMGLARRSDIPLAILFIDLDRFKAINDAYGHEAGDKVLQSAARAIMGELRGSDLLVRWGGEEFVAVLPNLRCEDAGAFLMRLRAAGLGSRPDGTPVTASVGISERQADAADDWARLVEIADRRMYQAKRAGRDCCVGCGDGLLSPP